MDITSFDIIGDVHGCLHELVALLGRLGYTVRYAASETDTGAVHIGAVPIGATAPPGRQAIFVGDLIDRGPDSVGVVRLVMGMCVDGSARMCIGNHDDKLRRFLHGNPVNISGSFAITVPEFLAEPESFRLQVRDWLDALLHAISLNDDVVVAHAAHPDGFTSWSPAKQRSVALFGIVDHSRMTPHGYPVRVDWAQDYSGSPLVVHGHTPAEAARHVNGVICVDTGCCFGGDLTAFRWPEWEVETVLSEQVYAHTPVPRIVCEPRQSVDFAAQQVR